MPRLRTIVLTAAALKAAAFTYSLWEAKQYTLRRVTVPVLEPGAESLRVLHISDLHLTPQQRDKVEWVKRLATLQPDLVINTGDNLAHPDAVELTLEAFEPLLATPGLFVMGSNDYYGPVWKNPARYLLPDSGGRVFGAPLPWQELRDGFTSQGWLDLDNTSTDLKVRSQAIFAVGTDDAHLDFDRYHEIDVHDTAPDVLRIGVTHAPYLRVVDAMTADRLSVLFAGHTHGGQLCVPGLGALVTNCDLPTSLAKGLHERDGSWLHVSAGLGTSPTAPVRFSCRPEATLVTLVPRTTTDF